MAKIRAGAEGLQNQVIGYLETVKVKPGESIILKVPATCIDNGQKRQLLRERIEKWAARCGINLLVIGQDMEVMVVDRSVEEDNKLNPMELK